MSGLLDNWVLGDMYATPPVLHVCRRCGERRPEMSIHDDLHEAVAAGTFPRPESWPSLLASASGRA